jgi:NADH-quinone oxidoreductase subunit M
LSTGALFLLVGMLYDRRHTKKFEEFGGLAKVMPLYAFFLVFAALASVGLPALNGFVGEFLILAGTYRSTVLELRLVAVLATVGVILAALYILKMLYLTLWGPITKPENEGLQDLGVREVVAVAPLCALMLWIGVAPQGFLEPSRLDIERTLSHFQQRIAEAPPREIALWGGDEGELVAQASADLGEAAP